jgi:hypothetical protein
MNPIYYTTLEQSKRLKELGVHQYQTEARWVKFGDNDWRLMPTVIFDESDYNATDKGEPQWYAAFIAQEIVIHIELVGNGFQIFAEDKLVYVKNGRVIEFGNYMNAQARADVKIWELENKK